MNNKSKQLLDVVEYSEAMLKDAEAGNWDKVIVFEAQRSELLEKLFSNPSGNKNVEDINNKIRKILGINKKIETIAANARENTRNEMYSINKGRQAVNLYAQNIL